MGRPRDVTDEEIVTTARRCFLAQGVHIAVKVIAEELGVSHATIFNRFGTKEALLIAALAPPSTPPFLAALKEGPDERELPVQLRALGRELVAYFEHIGAGWAALQAAGVGLEKLLARGARPTPLQAHDALGGWFRRARQRGLLGPRDPKVVAWTFLGALHYRVFQASIPNGGVGPCTGREIDAMVDLLWAGAAPPAGAGPTKPGKPPRRAQA